MLSDTKNKERDCQDSLIFHDSEKHQQQCHLAMAVRADMGDTGTVSEGCWHWLDLVGLSGSSACMVSESNSSGITFLGKWEMLPHR